MQPPTTPHPLILAYVVMSIGCMFWFFCMAMTGQRPEIQAIRPRPIQTIKFFLHKLKLRFFTTRNRREHEKE